MDAHVDRLEGSALTSASG